MHFIGFRQHVHYLIRQLMSAIVRLHISPAFGLKRITDFVVLIFIGSPCFGGDIPGFVTESLADSFLSE